MCYVWECTHHHQRHRRHHLSAWLAEINYEMRVCVTLRTANFERCAARVRGVHTTTIPRACVCHPFCYTSLLLGWLFVYGAHVVFPRCRCASDRWNIVQQGVVIQRCWCSASVGPHRRRNNPHLQLPISDLGNLWRVRRRVAPDAYAVSLVPFSWQWNTIAIFLGVPKRWR